MLFQRFDRLLFLAKGGKTVYFGEVGQNASILTKYFENNGAFQCPANANPGNSFPFVCYQGKCKMLTRSAEWMLEVIGAAPGSHTDIDWHKSWRESQEYSEVRRELDRLKAELPNTTQSSSEVDKSSFNEFAAPFAVQQWEVTKRVFEQYWRTPSYIYSKASLCICSVRSPLYLEISPLYL
jgi:ATP-binding cassette, subfamily G (WHITE), member 2, PDR